MSKEYFGEIMAKLKEAKESEKIYFSESFKQDLRKKLLAKAHLEMQSKFDIVEFFQKWKYVLGLVPTFAVLTIVAVNFSQLKLLFKGNEVLPIQTNPVYEDKAKNGSSIVQNMLNGLNFEESNIKTFPGYLVMPPQYSGGTSGKNDVQVKTSEKNFVPPSSISNSPLPESSPNLNTSSKNSSQNYDTSSQKPLNSSLPASESLTNSLINPSSNEVVISNPSILPTNSLTPLIGNTTEDQSTDFRLNLPKYFFDKPNIAENQDFVSLDISEPNLSNSNEESRSIDGSSVNLVTNDSLNTTLPSTLDIKLVTLSPDRVYFSNSFTVTEKELIYRVISGHFTRMTVVLVPGYFVQVELLDNGKVKAALFQNNELQITLFLEKNGDFYQVI